MSEQFQLINNNWQQSIEQIPTDIDGMSRSEQTQSLGFELQDKTYNYTQAMHDISPEVDYETILRSKGLYRDPNPQIIRRPPTADPIVYSQNIKIRFLQPPAVEQGPLIIKEVREPQPPPPPPIIIRQRAPPPLSPPPIILRERPPPIPAIQTAQVVTKILPAIQPPPRSVIIERMPALPPKPRDVIIERWIPYEVMQKRRVIVDRAEPPRPYPPPRNIIITYEPTQVRINRQIVRLGVTLADPNQYSSLYGESLLGTNELLSQIHQLGLTDVLSPPTQSPSYVSSQQQTYAPTADNLMHTYSASNSNSQSPYEEDPSSQLLAQYGLTDDSIPY